MKQPSVFALFLLFIATVSSCSTMNQPKSRVTGVSAAIPIPSTTIDPEEFYTKPLIDRWSINKNLVLAQDDISLAILGLQLSPDDTKVFYAVADKDPIQKIIRSARLTDNHGQISKLRKIIPIYKFKDLEIGLMSFEPRQMGATELYLTTSEREKERNTLITKFTGPSSEDRIYSTYMMREENSIQLGDSQIGFNLWNVNEGQPSAAEVAANSLQEGTTPTPASGLHISPNLRNKIPAGVIAIQGFSFSIENNHDKEVSIVNIHLLSDGSVLGISDDTASILTPILIETSVPATSPYPYPKLDEPAIQNVQPSIVPYP